MQHVEKKHVLTSRVTHGAQIVVIMSMNLENAAQKDVVVVNQMMMITMMMMMMMMMITMMMMMMITMMMIRHAIIAGKNLKLGPVGTSIVMTKAIGNAMFVKDYLIANTN